MPRTWQSPVESVSGDSGPQLGMPPSPPVRDSEGGSEQVPVAKDGSRAKQSGAKPGIRGWGAVRSAVLPPAAHQNSTGSAVAAPTGTLTHEPTLRGGISDAPGLSAHSRVASARPLVDLNPNGRPSSAAGGAASGALESGAATRAAKVWRARVAARTAQRSTQHSTHHALIQVTTEEGSASPSDSAFPPAVAETAKLWHAQSSDRPPPGRQHSTQQRGGAPHTTPPMHMQPPLPADAAVGEMDSSSSSSLAS